MLSMHIVGDGWGYVMGQMLRVQELVLLVPENNVCNKSSKRPKANVVFSVSSLWKIIYRKQFSSFTKDPKNVKPVNGPLFKPQHFQVTLSLSIDYFKSSQLWKLLFEFCCPFKGLHYNISTHKMCTCDEFFPKFINNYVNAWGATTTCCLSLYDNSMPGSHEEQRRHVAFPSMTTLCLRVSD